MMKCTSAGLPRSRLWRVELSDRSARKVTCWSTLPGTRPLAKRIAALGGVSRMFLTHQDDVADHRRRGREDFGRKNHAPGRHPAVARRNRKHSFSFRSGEARSRPDSDPDPGHTRAIWFCYTATGISCRRSSALVRFDSAARTPLAMSAGIHGRNRSARWNACSTTTSVGIAGPRPPRASNHRRDAPTPQRLHHPNEID